MPVRPTYPGVYVEEVSSGVRTVTGVATSVAAFVGSFRRGLVDEAVQLFSLADFEREYGGLDPFSETSYAIQQFFLNGGSEAWVVRVADTIGAPPPTPAARAAFVDLRSQAPAADVLRLTAGRRIRGASARDPGSWGNSLRVEIDYDTSQPAEEFNLTVSEVRVDGDRTLTMRSETFRNLTMRPNAVRNAIEVINAGSRLVQAEAAAGAPAPPPAPTPYTFRPAPTGTFGGGFASTVAIPADGALLDVDLILPGATVSIPNTPIRYAASAPATPAAYAVVLQEAIRRAALSAALDSALKPYLSGATVSLVDTATGAGRFHYHVRLGTGARPYSPRARIELRDAAVTGLKLTGTSVAQNAAQVALGGGEDGRPPPAGAAHRPIPLAAFQGSASAPKTGLHALDDVDLINIICIPEATTLDPAEMRLLYSAATQYARDRRSMLIVDMPEAAARSLDAAQTWLSENESLRDPNAAVYFPRTNLPDPLNGGRPRSVAASGTVAGLWARTDAQRGVWKAPAGTEARLRGVESLGCNLTDPENGVLNPLGVNALRTFPVYSSIAWGARTLEGADVMGSDWKYIPVRRLTLYLEESLYRGTKWVVFEPNDAPLWSQIRVSVGTFMHDLFRQGAFQGMTPRDAYFVKCDGETTTQSDIDRGVVNVEIGFAPLKPAEFVVLRIQQIVRHSEM
jgi:hypothetical protein